MTSLFASISPDLESLLRLGMAVVCGLAVGFNRAHHGSLPHPNRLRVHVLVGLSACLVSWPRAMGWRPAVAPSRGSPRGWDFWEPVRSWWRRPGGITNPRKCGG